MEDKYIKSFLLGNGQSYGSLIYIYIINLSKSINSNENN